ncbi:MAG TPA: glycoside hydrolase family 43 protein [Acidimicrobiales bacterium]|nr:glycoside hydrolase family 43 protein [Acidimicrobiales bacterium]
MRGLPGRPVLSAPAWPGDFPDPQVMRTDGGYVAFATNSGGSNVQVRTSPDLVTWDQQADGLPRLPEWAEPGRTWSPAAVVAPDGFVLWYVARYRRWGRQAISTAVASEPQGPFVDRSEQPTIFQADEGGSIDPSPFVDEGGDAYLVWKADANAVGRRSTLWGQRLAPDRRRLEGEPVCLLRYDRWWERPLVEAPSLVRAAGRYWLMYSAGRYDTGGYCMGLAVGDAPLGPFRKVSSWWRWVGSDRRGAGPGGQEPFVDGAGALRLAYHAWTPGQVGYRAGGQRTLRIGHLAVDGGRLRLSP